jgi:transcriptional regulator with XRE-family HTH domain
MMADDTDQLTGANLRYAQRVGARLRAVRRQRGLSLQAVEASSAHEFRASVLGAYERGERAISVPRLQRLARVYAVPVERLLPGDVDPPAGETDAPAGDARSARSDPGTVTIDLTRLHELSEPEADVLTRYLGAIQVERQDFNGRVLTIRRDDLRALASLFESTPDVFQRRLDDLGLRLVR